jgi:hypothetical protein
MDMDGVMESSPSDLSVAAAAAVLFPMPNALPAP